MAKLSETLTIISLIVYFTIIRAQELYNNSIPIARVTLNTLLYGDESLSSIINNTNVKHVHESFIEIVQVFAIMFSKSSVADHQWYNKIDMVLKLYVPFREKTNKDLYITQRP